MEDPPPIADQLRRKAYLRAWAPPLPRLSPWNCGPCPACGPCLGAGFSVATGVSSSAVTAGTTIGAIDGAGSPTTGISAVRPGSAAVSVRGLAAGGGTGRRDLRGFLL